MFVRVMRHKGQTSNAVLTQMTLTLKNGLFRASSAVVAKLTAFTAHSSFVGGKTSTLAPSST